MSKIVESELPPVKVNEIFFSGGLNAFPGSTLKLPELSQLLDAQVRDLLLAMASKKLEAEDEVFSKVCEEYFKRRGQDIRGKIVQVRNGLIRAV